MITKDNLRQKLSDALGDEPQEKPKEVKVEKTSKGEYSDISIEVALKKLK